MADDYGDLPKVELLKMAQKALDRNPGAVVHFKFTCQACGERCTFEEPNMLRESGECWRCGHATLITEGGFLLVLKVPR